MRNKKKKKGYTIRHGIHFVEWRRKTFFFLKQFLIIMWVLFNVFSLLFFFFLWLMMKVWRVCFMIYFSFFFMIILVEYFYECAKIYMICINFMEIQVYIHLWYMWIYIDIHRDYNKKNHHNNQNPTQLTPNLFQN